MKKLFAIVLCITATGCTSSTFGGKNGITSKNFAFQRTFASAEAELITPEGGTNRVKIVGYKSEAAQLVEAAFKGFGEGVRGAAK